MKIHEVLEFIRPGKLVQGLLALLAQVLCASQRLLTCFQQLPEGTWDGMATGVAHGLWSQHEQEAADAWPLDSASAARLGAFFSRICRDLPLAQIRALRVVDKFLERHHALQIAVPCIKDCHKCGQRLQLHAAQCKGGHPYFYMPHQPGVQGSEWVGECTSCRITYDIEGYQYSRHVGQSEVQTCPHENVHACISSKRVCMF